MSPFRLAFREEGDFVSVYLAPTDTLKGAILLGSLRVKMFDQPGIFDEYKALMKKWATLAINDLSGLEVAGFKEEKAPEHERSGKA